MKVFYITNNKTNEEEMVFGCEYEKAMAKAGMALNEWSCWLVEYAD